MQWKNLDCKLCELGLNVTGISFFLFSTASGKCFAEQILCSVALYWFSCLWIKLSVILSTTKGEKIIIFYYYCYTGGAKKRKDWEIITWWNRRVSWAVSCLRVKVGKETEILTTRAHRLEKDKANQKKWYLIIFPHRDKGSNTWQCGWQGLLASGESYIIYLSKGKRSEKLVALWQICHCGSYIRTASLPKIHVIPDRDESFWQAQLVKYSITPNCFL